jgi:hypothetical protein
MQALAWRVLCHAWADTTLELLFCAAMSQAHTVCEPPAPLPQNRVIVNISEAVREALRQRPAIRAMYLPTAEWTRAPEGSGVVGRHPCAPADESGVHFDTGTANLAHIQQVRCGGVGVSQNVVAYSERCSIALRSLAAVDERICVVGLLNELQTWALIGYLMLLPGLPPLCMSAHPLCRYCTLSLFKLWTGPAGTTHIGTGHGTSAQKAAEPPTSQHSPGAVLSEPVS